MWKSRSLFVFTILLALMLGVRYEDTNIGFTIVYAMALLFAISLATVLLAPVLIRIEESTDPQLMVKNESAHYTVTIRNRGFLFFPQVRCVFDSADVVGYEGGGPLLNFLGPRGTVTKEYTLRFPYRGVYNVGIQQVVITDFLGLFRRALAPASPQVVTVYPESDDRFALSVRAGADSSGLSNDLFNEDYTSVADVRKYTSSDNLRKIHWKLSAKRGELIVKNYQPYEPDRIILYLDTTAIPLDPLEAAAFVDRMVSYAASAVNHCAGGRLTADLVYGDMNADHLVVDELDELSEAYALLASVRFDGDAPRLAGIGQVTGPYNMVVFLSHLDGAVHDTLRSLISFDHGLILYYFYSDGMPLTDENAYLLESLTASGATVYRVDIGLEKE